MIVIISNKNIKYMQVWVRFDNNMLHIARYIKLFISLLIKNPMFVSTHVCYQGKQMSMLKFPRLETAHMGLFQTLCDKLCELT